MRAVQLKKFEGINGIEVVDIEKPKPAPGQVLVKVYASSINPFDIKLSEGMMPNLPLPITLGGDIAGVISEIGEGVENFSVGNKVYGSAIALAGATGAFAEFAAVPIHMIALMPKNIGFNGAAASVLVGVSAVQGLLEHGQLQAGHPPAHKAPEGQRKVLIHGGSGGIGTMAIQIAKAIGAHITTTATGDGIDYVKKLGADEVIDYKAQDFSELPADFSASAKGTDVSSGTEGGPASGWDVVFDTVGGPTYQKSFTVVKKSGIIVSMVMPVNEELMKEYGLRAISQFTQVTTERLDKLTKFIEQKNVKVHIDKVFSLEKIKEAFAEKQNEDVMGKIVIDIQNN